jgi:hypothetical protein
MTGIVMQLYASFIHSFKHERTYTDKILNVPNHYI